MTAPSVSGPDAAGASTSGGRTECTFEAAGWSCRSTGFLWFSEERAEAQYDYPCPRCNSELFLAKARRRADPKAHRLSCPCCGPGVAGLAYRSALDIVEREKFHCGS